MVVPEAQALLEGQQARAAEEAVRASPGAVAAREASRTAYQNIGADQAKKVVSEAFPQEVQIPAGGPPALPPGVKPAGFPTVTSESLDLGEGRHGVAASLEPIAVETSPGQRRAIDLALTPAGGGFVEATPAVGLRIPRALSEGAALTEAGVSLTPLDASGNAVHGSEGTVAGATVFYANTQTDVDTVIKPTSRGFQEDTVLRSVGSPQQLFFHVGVPQGATVSMGAGGALLVRQGTTKLASVRPPQARDAAGTVVPVSTTLSGETLELSVPHRAGEYRYPIVVDPTVIDEDTTSSEPYWHTWEATNWQYATSYPENFKHETANLGRGESECVRFKGCVSYGGPTENAGEAGAWVYYTQGASRIYGLTAETTDTNGSTANIESSVYVQSSSGIETNKAKLGSGTDSSNVCITEGCPPARVEPGHEGNAAFFQQSAVHSGEESWQNVLTRAVVWINQEAGPSVAFDTKSEAIEAPSGVLSQNVFYGNRWAGYARGPWALGAEASDPGVGLSKETWRSPNAPAWSYSPAWFENWSNCKGAQCERTKHWGRPLIQTPESEVLPDGEDTVELSVEDSVGLSATTSAKVRIDNTPPHGYTLTGFPVGNEVVDATSPLTLNASATDGSGTISSGVAAISLAVDGQALGAPAGSCTPGPCTAAGEWTLNPEAYGVGKHTVTVTGTDYAGNTSKEDFQFTIHHAAPIALAPGTLNPATGEFNLKSTDVSLAGPGAALTVQRNYNSRHVSPGAGGPLGPQWGLSLGAEQSVTSSTNGSMVLTNASGQQTTFTGNGNGSFTSPAGDNGVSLTEKLVGSTPELLLASSGTTTTFTHPNGPGTNTWTPAISEGAGGTNAVTYSFQIVTVNGVNVTEPTEELAPVPTGVSCSPTLTKGCRALTFSYATTTKAGEAANEWGEYNGRLSRVSFTAWSPTKKEMTTTPVAEYAFDSAGRLRAEWDPRITPALKNTLGYDYRNHVTAVSPPGQQPWLMAYGTSVADPNPGRVLSIARPSATTPVGPGVVPQDGAPPTLSSTTPVVGSRLSVSNKGPWINRPLSFLYEWRDCPASGLGECSTISGATNNSYTPQASDAGYTLMGLVIAENAAGATLRGSAPTGVVPLSRPKFTAAFGSKGTGSGRYLNAPGESIDTAGNVWITDNEDNRIEEFSPSGKFIQTVGWGVADGKAELEICTGTCRAGIAGSGSGQFSRPWGIAINPTTGHIYVGDQYNFRIEEFTPTLGFVRAFGAQGTGPGQFSYTAGMTVDASGGLWVVDSGNGRVQKFSSAGTYLSQLGSVGSGPGQLSGPLGIAVAGGNVYVTDEQNSRAEEFTTSGAYIRQFGNKGSGVGELSHPYGIASEPATGDLYITDIGQNRVQIYNASGAYVGSFGTYGSGNGQFEYPTGIVFNAESEIYVVDNNNGRIERWQPTYSTSNPPPPPPSVGTNAVTTIDYHVPVSGAGAPYGLGSKEVAAWGQSDLPVEATAIFPPDEPMGWPAKDYQRASIQYRDAQARLVNVAAPNGGIATTEFNETGDISRELTPDNRQAALNEGGKSSEVSKLLDTQSAYNSEGNELLSTLGPRHTVKLSTGSVVLARQSTKYRYDEGAPPGGPYRLVTKLTEAALVGGKEEDLRTVATSYSGQNNLGWSLRKPTSTAVERLVHTTFYEPKTAAVTETSQPAAGAPGEEQSYTWVSSFGQIGLHEPQSIAVDSTGNIYVLDTLNSHVDVFDAKGKPVRTFGTLGSANGQLKVPRGIALDHTGDVWIADTGNNRVEELTSTGEYIASMGSTSLKEPQGIAVDSENNVWVADTGNNQILDYRHGIPEDIELHAGGTKGSGNEQFNLPRGIAVGAEGDVYVADTGNNRVEQYSREARYIRTFASEGSGSGQLKAPQGIATDSAGNVWVADSGNNRIEAFSQTGTYLQVFGTEGLVQLKAPGGVAFDTEGNAWVTDTANGDIQRWSPHGNGYGRGLSPTRTQTFYYKSVSDPLQPAECGAHPEWANLPCRTQLAHQPAGSLPPIPSTTYTYNMWDEPETTSSTSGSNTRTTTQTYDAAARPQTTSVSSSVGTALPSVTIEYNPNTGARAAESSIREGRTETLTRGENTLGQPVSYTDADGNEATYKWDIDGRPETINDGKGIQTFGYDPITGALTTLKDSAAGTFTASYDANYQMTSEGYPNGMSANLTLDSTGREVSREYIKTTHCSSSCTWFTDSILPSITGHWASQTSSLSTVSYSEDNAGRLTRVQQTTTGKGCVTRLYSYDADTNRTGVTTREPGAEGKCATEGGSAEKHTYDEADRLNDANVSYSPFGNITALPAVDAGGSELTSSYYVDNQLASQTQNGQTLGYQLDPAERTRETLATGTRTSTVTNHYASPGSSPAWTTNTLGEWTREIHGINGALVAVQSNNEAPVLQLANLHGDVIGTAYLSETATKLASTADTSEYGMPTTSLPPKYSWLGALQLPTELPSGVVAMGARSYVPQLGRFLQPDPIPGAAANAYTYTNANPLTEADPTGAAAQLPQWIYETIQKTAEEGVARRAAEEAAARAAAEAAARAAAEEAARFAGLGAGAFYGGGEEEWWEEGGEEEEYEYASYHHDMKPGNEEAHFESGVLYQPLAESTEGQEGRHGGTPSVGSTVPLCKAGSEGPCAHGAGGFHGKCMNGRACKHRNYNPGRNVPSGGDTFCQAAGVPGLIRAVAGSPLGIFVAVGCAAKGVYELAGGH